MKKHEADAIKQLLECERDRDSWTWGKGWCEVGRNCGIKPSAAKALERSGLIESMGLEGRRGRFAIRLRLDFSVSEQEKME